MRSLRELQHRTYRAITAGRGDSLAPHLVDVTIPPATRMLVYTNNVRETVRKTLAASFPVVERLVGDACFRSLARAYATRYPSESGDLARFGARFPQLLDDFYRGGEFAYLASVAELEWACVESEVASDANVLDVSALRTVAATDYPRLGFGIHPAARVVRSKYPLFAIWLAHQAGEPGDVDMSAPGEHVLVYRQSRQVVLSAIDEPTLVFFETLRGGCDLSSAEAAAVAAAAEFNTAEALAEFHRLGLLIDFRLIQGPLAKR